ncbi:MAG: histidinol-phosphate transaminase [Anaerolineaceae bacterium]|nr:histidinol-phosphate transaminase [Anaerolineaceae bacterium]
MNIPTRFETISAYDQGEPLEMLAARLGLAIEQIVKLDANENPYGPSPKAVQALSDLRFPNYYPDAGGLALRTALAGFSSAPLETLMIGSGADELIDLLLRAVLDPEDKVLICPPAFSMYALDAQVNFGKVIAVNRRTDFSHDVPAICRMVEQERPRLMFITSPNNPDGSLIDPADLDILLDLPVLVVLDEAYIEFVENAGRLGEALSRIRQVPERENLIVLRTFSKWAGLAGLRVGFGAFPHWLVPVLWKVKPPYNVNAAAVTAALASLQDLDTLAERVGWIQAERRRQYAALCQIPYLQAYPSQGNFILCKVLGRDAGQLKNRLADHGILVRLFDSPVLPNSLRIGVGRSQDTDRLIEVLESEA